MIFKQLAIYDGPESGIKIPHSLEIHANIRLLPRKFKAARLVSRKFNSLATPFIYREFTLKPEILNPSSPVSIRVVDNFRRHTRSVHISQELDWDKAIKELSKCQFIRDLL